MTLFLTLGGAGVALLALALLIGDHVDGIFDALGGGEWFTGASLAGFLGALGFVGALTLSATDNPALAWGVGVASGLALGALVGWVTLRMRHSGSGSTPTRDSLVGLTGRVVSEIPETGFGTVTVNVAGHLTNLNARAGQRLPQGTEVWVVETLSPTSVLVRPTHD